METRRHDAMEVMDDDSLYEKIAEAIEKADDSGFSYDTIYTALHKIIDMCLHDYEIEKELEIWHRRIGNGTSD